MRRCVFQWRHAWWKLVLLRFLLYSSAATGQLVVSSSTVNFGSVQVGSNGTLSIAASNSGKSNLTISQAAVSGAGFSFTSLGLPITLAPQQSANLSVTFAPQASGTASGSMSVVTWTPIGNSGKQRSNNTTISLSGMGAGSGPLATNPTSLNFGTTQLGSSQSMTGTITNSSSSSVTISQASITGAAFSLGGLTPPMSLAPGQSQPFNVMFAPQSAGTAGGNIAVTSTASNSILNISLSGTAVTGGYLATNPSSLNFGSIQVSASQTQYVTLTNSGGSSFTISQATVTGTGFALSGFTAPETLAAGQSITFTVAFAPTLSGTSSGALTFTSNASDPTLSVSLSGTGTSPGQLSISPGSMSFGTIVVGTSQSQTGTLSASGSSVTVSSGTSSSSEFTLGGIILPRTIAAGQSVPFSVTFSPQASGTASANISFASNASISSTTDVVTGSGASTIQHNVDLSWNPSTSAVIGYNVYRGSISGGPYIKINSSLDAAANYTDGTIQSGQTYFYVTTAVDTSGMESSYSNEVSTIVPMP